MAVIGLEDDADATKCTGDPEADAGSGELTLTLANETAAITKITNTIAVARLATIVPPKIRFFRFLVYGQNFSFRF